MSDLKKRKSAWMSTLGTTAITFKKSTRADYTTKDRRTSNDYPKNYAYFKIAEGQDRPCSLRDPLMRVSK
jgi:hypothetical protein